MVRWGLFALGWVVIWAVLVYGQVPSPTQACTAANRNGCTSKAPVVPHPGTGQKIPSSWVEQSGGTSSPVVPDSGGVSMPGPARIEVPYGNGEGLRIPGTNPSAVVRADGTFHQGGYGGMDLPRDTIVKAGDRYHENHTGQVFVVTTGGRTAKVVPSAVPVVRHRRQWVAANQPVLIGFTGSVVPGWQYISPTACRTSRKLDQPRFFGEGFVTWPTVDGATVVDGTCTFVARRRNTLLQFADGAAVLRETAGVDSYDGQDTFVGGQKDANAASATLVPGDNSSQTLSIGKANVTGGPWYRAGNMVGIGNWQRYGGEDYRAGNAMNEIEAGSATMVFKVGGGARLFPPDIPPVVELRPGGTLPVGIRYCGTYSWYDKPLGLATKASLWAECVTTVAGMQSVAFSVPEDADFQWPAPQGGNNNDQTGVVLYVGDYEQVWKWCMTVDVLRKGETIIVTSDDQLKENQTCRAFNEATQPWFWIGNPGYNFAGTWRPGINMETQRSVVKPTEDNGYAYIHVRTCTGPGAFDNCTRGVGATCTTGMVEPAWNVLQNKDLIVDGTCRLLRLPFQYPTMGLAGDLVFINMHPDGSVVRWGEEGVTPIGRLRARDDNDTQFGKPSFKVQVLDGTAANPLARVLKEFGKDGVVTP